MWVLCFVFCFESFVCFVSFVYDWLMVSYFFVEVLGYFVFYVFVFWKEEWVFVFYFLVIVVGWLWFLILLGYWVMMRERFVCFFVCSKGFCFIKVYDDLWIVIFFLLFCFCLFLIFIYDYFLMFFGFLLCWF